MDRDLIAQSGFGELTRQDWLKMAKKAVGSEDAEQALRSLSDDGIVIEPLYDRNAQAQPVVRSHPEIAPAIVQRVDDTDPLRANRQAQDDIGAGATGLALIFEGAPNAFGYGLPSTPEALEQTLEGIALNRIHLRVDVHPQSRQSVDWLVALLTARRIDPSRLTLAFGIDPGAIFAGTGRLRMSIEALHASMPPSLAHFFALGVPGVLLEADGRVLHNAGATEAQELGFMLASALSHLKMFEDARQPLVYAAPHIGFALSVDQDQFLSMAKLRAMRKLWQRAQEACGITASPATIHAETSFRMLTRQDAENNILRNTIAVFSAMTGGADSISVLPHSLPHGLPDPSARRLARNTSLVLAGESRVDFAADPAAGSGGLEALTDALAHAGWREFQQIESEGGVLRSLSAGAIQRRVQASAAARARAYAEKTRAIVGVTLYPPAKERPIAVLDAARRPMPEDGTVFCEKLPAQSIEDCIGEGA